MIENARSPEDAVAAVEGSDVTISRSTPVSGGCIANGARLSLSNGRTLFLKRSRTLPFAMFSAEARGLTALRSQSGPRIPQPRALGAGHSGGESFILMEWIESGRPGPGFHERFGRALARMHRALAGEKYGFDADNYIGSTPQKNGWYDTWCEFFAVQRIGFQVRLARDAGRVDSGLAAQIDTLTGRINSILVEPERPALLHGDLWGGNYLCDDSGQPVLIDPAVYHGHPEADLAMTELFGGFTPAFYRGYEDESPLQPGYRDRRDLYNLYHVLNHLNIFGGGYLGNVRSIVARY